LKLRSADAEVGARENIWAVTERSSGGELSACSSHQTCGGDSWRVCLTAGSRKTGKVPKMECVTCVRTVARSAAEAARTSRLAASMHTAASISEYGLIADARDASRNCTKRGSRKRARRWAGVTIVAYSAFMSALTWSRTAACIH